MGCASSTPDTVDATAMMSGTGTGFEKQRNKGAILRSFESVRSVIEAFPINEQELAQFMTSLSKEHLAQFSQDYQAQSGTDLLALLREKLNGPLERLILSCFKTDVVLRTELIREAIQGKTTDVAQLTDAVLTLNENAAQQVTSYYDLIYGTSVVSDIKQDYNGDKLWQRLIILILTMKRISRAVAASSNPATASTEADPAQHGAENTPHIYSKVLATDTETLVSDIREHNFEHLIFLMATALPEEYRTITKRYFSVKGTVLRQDIADALERRPEEQYALLLMHDCLHNPAQAYSLMIHIALTSSSCRDDARLSRAAALSYDTCPDVARVYCKQYGRPLNEIIESAGAGTYEYVLMLLWRVADSGAGEANGEDHKPKGGKAKSGSGAKGKAVATPPTEHDSEHDPCLCPCPAIDLETEEKRVQTPMEDDESLNPLSVPRTPVADD